MRRRLLALFMAVALTACVDTSGTTPATTEAIPPTSTTLGRLGLEQATLEFGSCMRALGVETPEVRLDAQGRPILDDLRRAVDIDGPEFRGALTECAPILVGAGALDLRRDPELRSAILEHLRAFSECMRVEGYTDFPDPDPAFSGVGSAYPLDELPAIDEAFEASVAVCQGAVGIEPPS